MLRRIAPVLGLFALSPLVAEFLLGNVAIDALPLGLVMAPMYGGGAVLVREAARRAGKGWPTIALLALAFGLIEEGLVTQTLFSRSFFGYDLLRETYIPALGMGAWWTLFVLTLHTIWSICVPIALVESLVPGRSTSPWLGRFGLAASAAAFVLGGLVVFGMTYSQERFVARPSQLLGIVATVVAVVTAAFLAKAPRRRPGSPPEPWKAGAFAFLAASAFLGSLYLLSDWPLVAAYLLIYGLAAVLIVRWSGKAGWGPPHRLALAGGALLTYAWHAFIEQPVIGSTGAIDLAGNATFALAAVALLVLAWRTTTRAAAPMTGP